MGMPSSIILATISMLALVSGRPAAARARRIVAVLAVLVYRGASDIRELLLAFTSKLIICPSARLTL